MTTRISEEFGYAGKPQGNQLLDASDFLTLCFRSFGLLIFAGAIAIYMIWANLEKLTEVQASHLVTVLRQINTYVFEKWPIVAGVFFAAGAALVPNLPESKVTNSPLRMAKFLGAMLFLARFIIACLTGLAIVLIATLPGPLRAGDWGASAITILTYIVCLALIVANLQNVELRLQVERVKARRIAALLRLLGLSKVDFTYDDAGFPGQMWDSIESSNGRRLTFGRSPVVRCWPYQHVLSDASRQRLKIMRWLAYRPILYLTILIAIWAPVFSFAFKVDLLRWFLVLIVAIGLSLVISRRLELLPRSFSWWIWAGIFILLVMAVAVMVIIEPRLVVGFVVQVLLAGALILFVQVGTIHLYGIQNLYRWKSSVSDRVEFASLWAVLYGGSLLIGLSFMGDALFSFGVWWLIGVLATMLVVRRHLLGRNEDLRRYLLAGCLVNDDELFSGLKLRLGLGSRNPLQSRPWI